MRGKLLHPVIDHILTYPRDMDFEATGLSMRLRSKLFGSNSQTHRIASNKKYKFSFLAKDVPNVRSLFIIHGQRYICEKITANFTEDGMSELMKGEFWLVED